VVDRPVQLFDGAGVNDDAVLARMLVRLRSLRNAHEPDAVHQRTVALLAIHEEKMRRSSSRSHDLHVANCEIKSPDTLKRYCTQANQYF
jgi:hypothetical protein